MKIVKFKDGRYGIRKFSLLGFMFLDLETPRHWWPSGSRFKKDCFGTLDQVTKLYMERTDRGTT